MAPRRWATDEQRMFLESYLEKFIEHQKYGVLTKFWPHLERKWFKRWPVILDNDEITPEEQVIKTGLATAAKKKQLKEWFQNQSQSMKRVKRNKGISLDFNPKASRRLQVTETYAAKYYDSKIKPMVQEELATMKDRPRYDIGVVKRNIKKAWDEESDEVRCQVIEEFNTCEPKTTSSTSPHTPKDYAS
ncbi:hypothetical protein C0992_009823, partial [Termitomyces sp. T32_za158]